MKTPFTSRRFDVFVLAVAAFGAGGLVGSATAEPEVVTVSEDVPSSCGDAARTAAAGFKAWENLDQYEVKAEVLAADLTLVTLAADASLIEDALRPIAEHNEKKAKWRARRDDARSSFETAADQCLAKVAAAEAARDR